MFDFEPLNDEQLEELAKIESRYHEARSRAAIKVLVDLRKEVGDAFVALDVVVLKPVCEQCLHRLTGDGDTGYSKVNIVRVWPELADGRLRLYDRGSHQLFFFDNDGNPDGNEHEEREFHSIECYLCSDRMNDPDEDLDIFSVVPTSFSEFFGLEEEGPNRARGRAMRRTLADLYGNSCFQCKQPLALTDVTLDHIVARANGGEAVAANLQVLCLKCNQAKKDGEVVTVELALDFPLRPAPWETYEDLVW
jgi:hypothetical protein